MLKNAIHSWTEVKKENILAGKVREEMENDKNAISYIIIIIFLFFVPVYFLYFW